MKRLATLWSHVPAWGRMLVYLSGGIAVLSTARVLTGAGQLTAENTFRSAIELSVPIALAGLGGVDPAEAAHIGDLRRTDVAGARGIGMRAVRYRGVFDDPGRADDGSDQVEGDAVIDDHADLLAALDLP